MGHSSEQQIELEWLKDRVRIPGTGQEFAVRNSDFEFSVKCRELIVDKRLWVHSGESMRKMRCKVPMPAWSHLSVIGTERRAKRFSLEIFERTDVRPPRELPLDKSLHSLMREPLNPPSQDNFINRGRGLLSGATDVYLESFPELDDEGSECFNASVYLNPAAMDQLEKLTKSLRVKTVCFHADMTDLFTDNVLSPASADDNLFLLPAGHSAGLLRCISWEEETQFPSTLKGRESDQKRKHHESRDLDLPDQILRKDNFEQVGLLSLREQAALVEQVTHNQKIAMILAGVALGAVAGGAFILWLVTRN